MTGESARPRWGPVRSLAFKRLGLSHAWEMSYRSHGQVLQVHLCVATLVAVLEPLIGIFRTHLEPFRAPCWETPGYTRDHYIPLMALGRPLINSAFKVLPWVTSNGVVTKIQHNWMPLHFPKFLSSGVKKKGQGPLWSECFGLSNRRNKMAVQHGWPHGEGPAPSVSV